MSDLISRSKVIAVLEKLEEHSLTGKMDISNAIYLLENQPTSYDIDKVVENVRCRCYEFGLDESQTEIIVSEIVKQGGVRNEVAEYV